jgi:hypothetical protein
MSGVITPDIIALAFSHPRPLVLCRPLLSLSLLPSPVFLHVYVRSI